MAMSNCMKLLSELSNYLDGEIDGELRAEIESHAHRCPQCYIVIDSTRKTVQIFKDCGPYDVSAELHARIEQAVRMHVEKSKGHC
jgi:anti-sigma factor RsiW